MDLRQNILLPIGCAVIAAGAATFAMYHFTMQAFCIHGMRCEIDNRFTVPIQQTLAKAANRYAGSLCFSIQNIADDLKNEFPFIDSISILCAADGIGRMAITAHDPAYLVNNKYVLTNNGLLFEKTVFESSAYAKLPTACVNEQSLHDQATIERVQTCLAGLPNDFFESYEINWCDETCLQLQDKREPNFTIVCEDDYVPGSFVLQKCNAIKEQLTQRGAFSSKKKKMWVADIRFGDQIIVSAREGGKENGTHNAG